MALTTHNLRTLFPPYSTIFQHQPYFQPSQKFIHNQNAKITQLNIPDIDIGANSAAPAKQVPVARPRWPQRFRRWRRSGPVCPSPRPAPRSTLRGTECILIGPNPGLRFEIRPFSRRTHAYEWRHFFFQWWFVRSAIFEMEKCIFLEHRRYEDDGPCPAVGGQRHELQVCILNYETHSFCCTAEPARPALTFLKCTPQKNFRMCDFNWW